MTEKSLTHEARIRALEREMFLASNPSTISLKEHIEVRLVALEKATEVTATAMERRRNDLDKKLESVNAALVEFRTFKDRLESKASQSSVLIAYGLAAIGIIFSLLNYLAK